LAVMMAVAGLIELGLELGLSLGLWLGQG